MPADDGVFSPLRCQARIQFDSELAKDRRIWLLCRLEAFECTCRKTEGPHLLILVKSRLRNPAMGSKKTGMSFGVLLNVVCDSVVFAIDIWWFVKILT